MISAKEFLTCYICKKIAQDAFECEFCQSILCGKCEEEQQQKNQCINCKKKKNYQPCILARRMVDSLESQCEFCESKVLYSQLKVHIMKCSQRILRCGVVQCQYQGRQEEFLKHLFEQHSYEIIQQFEFKEKKIQTTQPNKPTQKQEEDEEEDTVMNLFD